jgi:hypothetical protein
VVICITVLISGKPASNRRTLKPRARSSATASNDRTQDPAAVALARHYFSRAQDDDDDDSILLQTIVVTESPRAAADFVAALSNLAKETRRDHRRSRLLGLKG